MLSWHEAAILLAASTSSSNYTPTAPGGLFVGIMCYRARRSQVGGWLLFFYWQLYSGVLLTALFFSINLQSYIPENFDSHTKYLLFIISTVPAIILVLIQVGIGTLLLCVRTWDLLKLLRWLIAAEIALACLSTAIDASYFPDNVALNFLTIIPQSLWLAYLFRSKRVKHVFKSHDWEIAVNSIYPPELKAVT
jgi:hypothetical protein